MKKSFKLPSLTCLRCTHTWIPRKPVEPKFCPKCRSPYWNKPRTKKGRWKFNLGDRIIANEKAPGDYEDFCGSIVERGPGKAEYGVRFDRKEETVYLNSWSLEKLP